MSKNERPEAKAIPYTGPPLKGVLDDLIIPKTLIMEETEKYWVPLQPNVAFRPLMFSISQGYYVNLVRVQGSGIISRHRHSGPVHATTIKGRWHYLEHEWWAEEGTYSFEPPGDIHTLEVPEGVDEMITWFHVSGSYTYCDPEGNPQGVEDVFTRLETARQHYAKSGVGAEYADSLIR